MSAEKQASKPIVNVVKSVKSRAGPLEDDLSDDDKVAIITKTVKEEVKQSILGLKPDEAIV